MSKEVRGYKVFNQDWTCRDKQYTCPGEFKENCTPRVCEKGMHFCKKASDCFLYYDFNPENKVAEVIATGDVKGSGNKFCTNSLKIVREIPWKELLELVNIGKGCTGMLNTGNCNVGDWNKANCSNGCFNTEPQKIFMFNKPSDWTLEDWRKSKAAELLGHIPKSAEKGDEATEKQDWWERLSSKEKQEILSLPNFDKEIFKEITRIDVGAMRNDRH